ncbi:hypothetical protein Tco_1096932 [Tanacetum coccineum]
MAQHVIPAAQLVPQYKPIRRCNNYAVLQSIPCSPECKIVGLILLDHCLSHALTATADVPAVNLQQFFRTVSKDTFLYHETPENPFVAPADIHTIEAFMNIVGYQGVVDKKKEAIQYPRFIKLIVADLMKKFSNIPKSLKEDYHFIKDDVPLVSVYTTGNVLVRGMLIPNAFLTSKIRETGDFKEYEMVFMKVAILMNQPQPVVSTQGTNRNTPRAGHLPFLLVLRNRRRGSKLQENPDNPKVVDDDDKEREKKDDEMGALRRMCRRQGYMIQDMERKCITTAKFWETHNKINDILHEMKRNLQDRADNIALWEPSRSKFDNSSTSNTSCREDVFHSHHDEHQDDDAPPEGEKRVKRSKKSKRSKSARGSSSKHSRKDSTTYVSKQQSQHQEWDAWEEENVIDEDEVIPEDVTPELIAES